jgi:DNA-binding SARP family transcriptional activator
VSNLPQPTDGVQTSAGAPAQLLLLGDFVLIDPNGRSIDVPTRKNRALLAILALSSGRRVTRERICGLLWSDRAEEQARSSLRQSLAALRKELGGDEDWLIHTRDDQILLRSILA